MMWLLPGIVVMYIAMLASFYYVPAKRVIEQYAETPSSAAAVPGADEAAEAEEEARTRALSSADA